MNIGASGLLNFADGLQIESLQQRLKRAEVITANVSNAETPGFRAIGYDFEEQLQDVAGLNEAMPMATNDARHFHSSMAGSDGTINPEVYVRPTESVGNDGNTVDMDFEMSQMAQNNLMIRAVIETLNRKVGMLRYAINGGR